MELVFVTLLFGKLRSPAVKFRDRISTHFRRTDHDENVPNSNSDDKIFEFKIWSSREGEK